MKIQLKRSNVLVGSAAKEPSSGQMEYGELAVNYNETDPAIFIKDSNNNIIRIAGADNIADDGTTNVPSGTTPPENAEAGNLWFNDEEGRLYIYYVDADSSQWVDASPDSWDPSSYPDVGIDTPQAGTLDDRYLMLSAANDPITSDLEVQGNITVSGTVDGRDVAADGLKLDGIESGADVSQWVDVTGGINYPSGKVGIGTATPAIALHVSGNGSINSSVRLTNLNDTGNNQQLVPGVVGVNNEGFSIYDADREVTTLRIDSTGKVGINTNTPIAGLHVSRTDGWAGAFYANTSTSGDPLSRGLTIGWNKSSGKGESNIVYGTDIGNESNLQISSFDGTNYRDRVSIDPDGNVGIGTDNPSAPLHVFAGSLSTDVGKTIALSRFVYGDGNVGNIYLNATRVVAGTSWTSTTSKIQFQVDSTAMGYVAFNPHTTEAGDGEYAVSIGNSSTETIRFTKAGNVGIGTTTPYSKLTVRNTDSTSICLDIDSIENGSWAGIGWNASNGDLESNRSSEIRGYRQASGALGYLTFNTRGNDNILNERMRITSDGDVGIGTIDPKGNLQIVTNTSGDRSITFGASDLSVTGGNNLVTRLYAHSKTDLTKPSYFELKTYETFVSTDKVSKAVTIDVNGKVGIGTDSPVLGTLHVNQGSNDFALNLQEGSSANPKILFTTTAGNIGGTAIEGAPDTSGGFLAFTAGGSERVRILGTGGLTFNGDTAADNALDDYEEGTWTPSLTAENSGTGVFTPDGGTNGGIYIKVGNEVYVQFNLRGTWTAGTASGAAYITGLPYNVISNSSVPGSSAFASCVIPFINGVTLSAANTVTGGLGQPGANTIRLFAGSNAGSTTFVQISNFGSGPNVHGSMIYKVA